MYKNLSKVILLLLIIVTVVSQGYAQSSLLSLEDAIRMAWEHSLDYKVARYSYQSSFWDFRNFSASFKPTLYLDGTIPNYSRTISKITLPNGEDTFVNQNQAYSSLNIGLRQNVAFTGGTVSLGSSLSRIDVFGNNQDALYSAIPASVSYVQNVIGYNEFNWLKKTEPLRFEIAQKDLVTNKERIAGQTVDYYFEMLAVQLRRQLSQQNLGRADTLFRIASERFELGSVSQSELLQLRLNVLNARNAVTQDSISMVLARQQFTSYLDLNEEVLPGLILPENTDFFEVPFDEALRQSLENSKVVAEYRLKRMEAEKNVARTRAENNLRFNLQANLGLSNTARNIPGLFNNLENQQNILLGFSLPILDWGFAKTQKLRAEANLDMVKNQTEQSELRLEQEMALYVARWNAHREQLAMARESQEIAARNYNLEMRRYLAGSITINDMNIAQSRRDQAFNSYISVVHNYWSLYYTLRRLTLYDFNKKEVLTIKITE